jgi:hypothetical protein
MSLVFAIALFWVLTSIAYFAAFWHHCRQPISDAEQWCAYVDQALRRQYRV